MKQKSLNDKDFIKHFYILVFIISVFMVGSANGQKIEHMRTKKIYTFTYSGAIFPKNHYRSDMYKTESFTPTYRNIFFIERRLKLGNIDTTSLFLIEFNQKMCIYKKWKRQYQGFIINDKKIIKINFINYKEYPKKNQKWQNSIIYGHGSWFEKNTTYIFYDMNDKYFFRELNLK